MGLFCMWADTVTITRLSRLPRPLWNSPLPDPSQVTAQLAELGKLEDNFATKFCYKAATKKPQQQNSYWGSNTWRRKSDSNPRYAINVYALSRGAPSATRPFLQNFYPVTLLVIPIHHLKSRPGRALTRNTRVARSFGPPAASKTRRVLPATRPFLQKFCPITLIVMCIFHLKLGPGQVLLSKQLCRP